jgi:DNA repair photolyase
LSDISFDRSINPYRGCEPAASAKLCPADACFLGLRRGSISIKTVREAGSAAPARARLSAANYARVPSRSGPTPTYQPIEKQHQVMRRISKC